jgi:hypothetical protein
LDGDAIVSDVWLDNHGPDTLDRPWRNGAEMPFRNPAEFTSGDDIGEPMASSAVGIRWLQRMDLESEQRSAFANGPSPGLNLVPGRDGPPG